MCVSERERENERKDVFIDMYYHILFILIFIQITGYLQTVPRQHSRAYYRWYAWIWLEPVYWWEEKGKLILWFKMKVCAMHTYIQAMSFRDKGFYLAMKHWQYNIVLFKYLSQLY